MPVDPDTYAAKWPGRPEILAAEEQERKERWAIPPEDEPPDAPLQGFEPPDETTVAYNEPVEDEAELVEHGDELMARMLLDRAIEAEDGRPATKLELLLTAQVCATLELARATRAATPTKPAHAWRVSRETGQLTDMGPVS